MTSQQIFDLTHKKSVQRVPGEPICYNPSQVAPPPVDNMAHTALINPPTEKDYNQLSGIDVLDFNQYRYTDTLHRGDMVAKVYDRSQRLRSDLKEFGEAKFKKFYNLN